MNTQPWRFVVKEHEIYLFMIKSDNNSRSLVDIGVSMFYFEEMAKTIGRYGKWDIILKDNSEYLEIAKFTM